MKTKFSDPVRALLHSRVEREALAEIRESMKRELLGASIV
jgi:hypothetical protein